MQLHEFLKVLKIFHLKFSPFYLASWVVWTLFQEQKALELPNKINKKVQSVCEVVLILETFML